uniref:Slc13a-6 n=1 Tax=Schmidtea mediterranea TaxID=79327 RepID=A0A0H3YEZ9_SCHMD|nr:slc13a-6 [Schmidtea mediterranea]
MKKNLNETIKFCKHNWRTVFLISIPILFLPMTFSGNKPLQCGYIIIIVGLFWITEVMDIAVTSLIPVVLFPIFKILDPESVATCFMKDITLMLLGGLIVAKTVEEQNLHKRLALHILKLMGPNLIFQYLGFMSSTWFLSMWINNASTTAMMIPLAEAVTLEWLEMAMKKRAPVEDVIPIVNTNENQINHTETTSTYESEEHLELEVEKAKNISKGLFLGIAYAATCGGMATISGTAPNIVFYGHMKDTYGSKLGLNYGSFMLFSFPVSLTVVSICWVLLISRYIGINETFHRKVDKESDKKINKSFKEELKLLGPISYGEISILVVFVCLILLWILREPGFPLIARLFTYKIKGKDVKFWSDGVSAIIATFFVLNLPAKNPFRTPITKPSKKLISWKTVESGISWGIIFLFGGGFALAAGVQASGLSYLIADFLRKIGHLPQFLILFIVSFGISMLTEITSNTVTVTIMLPILTKMAECIHMHPMRMALTVALSSSFSFCLPAATLPNAIILSTGRVHVIDMATSGFCLNLICVVVMTFMAYYYSWLIFGTNVFPDWIHPNCSSFN